jgi:hypothetical protein
MLCALSSSLKRSDRESLEQNEKKVTSSSFFLLQASCFFVLMRKITFFVDPHLDLFMHFQYVMLLTCAYPTFES